ncbi:MAG: hypothetical protein LBK61_14530 [Spirochaetaceae bacterium]|nr:hypothetical protein [Spirochaetaceae bacterium]
MRIMLGVFCSSGVLSGESAPFTKYAPGNQRNQRTAPAGGENPQGFHPYVKLLPVLAERAAAWQAEHPLTAEGPCRGRKPAGFSSLREASPHSGRKSSGMAGRAPPYGGGSLRGAKTRRVFIPT